MPTPRVLTRPDLPQQLAAFQAALPGSRGEAYLQQRSIPLTLALQYGVGYAAPGTWPHAARDWRGGRVVFPHTMPDGRLVNLYGRAVGTAEEVPKAKRHDLPGRATSTPGCRGGRPCGCARTLMRWRCVPGVPRVVAIYGVRLAGAGPRVSHSSLLWMRTPGSSSGGARAAGCTPGQAGRSAPRVWGWKMSEAWVAGVLCLDGGVADIEALRDAVPQGAGRPVPSGGDRSWTGVSHLRRPRAARGRETRRQTLMERPAARESMARRAEGWDWTARPSWARGRSSAEHHCSTADDYGYRRHTPKHLREPPWRTS